jgi:calcium-dependent protein kinase
MGNHCCNGAYVDESGTVNMGGVRSSSELAQSSHHISSIKSPLSHIKTMKLGAELIKK